MSKPFPEAKLPGSVVRQREIVAELEEEFNMSAVNQVQSSVVLCSIVLYCIVLHCIVLYCIVLCCVELHCSEVPSTAVFCTYFDIYDHAFCKNYHDLGAQ